MFQFIGYNFFSDGDALNSAPSMVNNITTIRLTNAIYDHFNVTKDTSTEVTTTIPTEWDFDTVMNADFEGDLNAGNVDFLVEQVSAIKIKRRITGTFNWLTLKTIPINTIEDFTFVFNDLLNGYGTQYDYALVPVMEDVESEYIINSILSEFNGVFIGDQNTIYKFLYDVSYGTNAVNQKVGTFEPLGNQYPIIVANGDLSYESGVVSATILNTNYDDIRKIDPPAIVQEKNAIKSFLTNKGAKILKDWNGNKWLCMVTNNPQITYKIGSNMAIPQVQFSWTQIGDSESQADLYNNGILPTLT